MINNNTIYLEVRTNGGWKVDLKEFKSWIVDEIKSFVRTDPDNRIKIDGSPFFDEPLVGFVSGADPIFRKLKEAVGPFHLTPHEVMASTATKDGFSPPEPDDIGVISYILPISEKTRRENASMRDGPSERWAHTRLFGEQFNKKLQSHLVDILREAGYIACAPELDEGLFRLITATDRGRASTWSQRHVAYAAGLGTFGLSDGLITVKGKAHRCGSVVVNQRMDSPQRPSDIHAYCTFYQKGGCMVCARRCPVGAIGDSGHDKERCAEFVYGQEEMIMERYGIDIYACGLCQTGVPCESCIPAGVLDQERQGK